MARTVRDARLETRAARAKLAPGPAPFYRALDPGLHLGYRKGKTGGKWVMRIERVVRPERGSPYSVETIGTADDTADADGVAVLSYPQAQVIARAKRVERARVARGLPAQDAPYTVGLCVREYLGWLDRNRKSAVDLRYRAEALILPELGDVPCLDLTAAALRKWRDKIGQHPPRLRTRRGEAQKFRVIGNDDEARRRRKATAN